MLQMNKMSTLKIRGFEYHDTNPNYDRYDRNNRDKEIVEAVTQILEQETPEGGLSRLDLQSFRIGVVDYDEEEYYYNRNRDNPPPPRVSANLFERLNPLCLRIQHLTISNLHSDWSAEYKLSLTNFVVALIKSEPPLTHLDLSSYGGYYDYRTDEYHNNGKEISDALWNSNICNLVYLNLSNSDWWYNDVTKSKLIEVIAVQQNLEDLILTSCLSAQDATEAVLIQLVHTPVFQTIKRLVLSSGYNLDKDESCELLADLLATGPKFERISLGSYGNGSR